MMKLFFKALVFLGLLPLAALTQTLRDTTLLIADCVNEFDSTKVESTKAGFQYWFVDKQFLDGRTLKMSVVAPNEATHIPHSHAEDEIFFVLEGTAELTLEGEVRIVKPYASFYCPPDSNHGIRNVGDTDLKYLVIKTYDRSSTNKGAKK